MEGCAAILKPSEISSMTCLELAEKCREVGPRPGVLNLLDWVLKLALLASHPNVDKIAFTGSTASWSKIMAAASQMVKLRPLWLSLDSLLDYTDKDIEESTFELVGGHCLSVQILPMMD